MWQTNGDTSLMKENTERLNGIHKANEHMDIPKDKTSIERGNIEIKKHEANQETNDQ